MARYDGLRKPAFKRKVIAFREANPELSMKEVGAKFGITGARVSQIIRELAPQAVVTT